MCDVIMYVMDIVPKNVANTIATNVTSAVSTNFYKKVRYKMDFYILHTVLLVIILLFMIAIICYHYAKHFENILIDEESCKNILIYNI